MITRIQSLPHTFGDAVHGCSVVITFVFVIARQMVYPRFFPPFMTFAHQSTITIATHFTKWVHFTSKSISISFQSRCREDNPLYAESHCTNDEAPNIRFKRMTKPSSQLCEVFLPIEYECSIFLALFFYANSRVYSMSFLVGCHTYLGSHFSHPTWVCI